MQKLTSFCQIKLTTVGVFPDASGREANTSFDAFRKKSHLFNVKLLPNPMFYQILFCFSEEKMLSKSEDFP